MDEAVVGAAWYTPASWLQLEEAVAAAGLPKTILAGSYAEFVVAFDAQARTFARQGVKVEKVPGRRSAHGGLLQALGARAHQCGPDKIRRGVGGGGRRP